MKDPSEIRRGFAELLQSSNRLQTEQPGHDPQSIDAAQIEREITEKAEEPPRNLEESPPRRRGAQKSPKKVQISLRLDPDVLNALKAGGKGWQSRLNADLRSSLGLDKI